MKTDEITSFREKILETRNLYKDPIWNDFKVTGVSGKWNIKFKIKLFLAKTGLLPIIYNIYNSAKII